MTRQFKWLCAFLALTLVSCGKARSSHTLTRPTSAAPMASPSNLTPPPQQNRILPPPSAPTATANPAPATPLPEQQEFQQNKLGDPIVPVAPTPDVGDEASILPPGPNDNQLLGGAPTNQPQSGAVPTENAAACGESYMKNDPYWYPGLPYQPAAIPLRTGGFTEGNISRAAVDRDSNLSYQFTDAGHDGLLALATDRMNALPSCVNHNSKALAIRIRSFALFRRKNTTEIKFGFLERPGDNDMVILSGEGGRNVKLVQIPTRETKSIRFAGSLVCADSQNQGACQNYLVRIRHLTRSGKTDAIAFVLYREGGAHLTISEADRRNFSAFPNQGHSLFARFLSNTANNACLDLLAGVDRGYHALPDCAVRRLRERCGGEQSKSPAASSIDLVTWAAAYGNSEFGLVVQSNRRRDRLVVSGPLVYSKYRPMWYKALNIDRNGSALASYIKSAYLVANDGGGDLNLKFNFHGSDSQGPMRLNVTAIGGRTDAQMVSDRLPQLPASDLTCSQGLDVVAVNKVAPQKLQVKIAKIDNPVKRHRVVRAKKAPVVKRVKPLPRKVARKVAPKVVHKVVRKVEPKKSKKVHHTIKKAKIGKHKIEKRKVERRKVVKHKLLKHKIAAHKAAPKKRVTKHVRRVRHAKRESENPLDQLGDAIKSVFSPQPEKKSSVRHVRHYKKAKKHIARANTKKVSRKVHRLTVQQVEANPLDIK